jgi:ATP-dependent DNA helicase RecG
VQEVNGRPIYPLKGVQPEKLDSFQKSIFAKCKLLRPSYTPIISVEKYQGKYFIVIWCPGGDNRPYSSPKTMERNNKERIHYIRKASNTVAPSDDEEKDLFNLANRVPFDDRVNHQAEITDLNITLIQNYLREIGSSLYEKSITGDFTELCSDMNIISILPEYVKPKNVGLMFFCAQPDKFFPFTQIDVVQFPDGLGGDNIIENTFKGPIHHQLREALQFIKNSIVSKKIVKSAHKAESDWVFNYPYAALEEALANAVYHRAYDIREPIEVRVEKNMIEIVSFPGPDRSVTQEGLKRYKVSNRRYRNRRIGDILKELHLTEGRNTGFGKILSALEENGSPKPEFETDEGHNYFITRLFIHEAFMKQESKGAKIGLKGAGIEKKGAEVDAKGAKAEPKGAKGEPKGAEIEEKGAKVDAKGAKVGQKGAEVEPKGAEVGLKGAEIEEKGAEVKAKGAKVEPKGAEIEEKGVKVDAKGAKKGTERRLEILNRMRENPFVTQVKLMEEFNLSRKQIQNIIQYLRQNGMVDREGSNRSGKWIVKK